MKGKRFFAPQAAGETVICAVRLRMADSFDVAKPTIDAFVFGVNALSKLCICTKKYRENHPSAAIGRPSAHFDSGNVHKPEYGRYEAVFSGKDERMPAAMCGKRLVPSVIRR